MHYSECIPGVHHVSTNSLYECSVGRREGPCVFLQQSMSIYLNFIKALTLGQWIVMLHSTKTCNSKLTSSD